MYVIELQHLHIFYVRIMGKEISFETAIYILYFRANCGFSFYHLEERSYIYIYNSYL